MSMDTSIPACYLYSGYPHGYGCGAGTGIISIQRSRDGYHIIHTPWILNNIPKYDYILLSKIHLFSINFILSKYARWNGDGKQRNQQTHSTCSSPDHHRKKPYFTSLYPLHHHHHFHLNNYYNYCHKTLLSV